MEVTPEQGRELASNAVLPRRNAKGAEGDAV